MTSPSIDDWECARALISQVVKAQRGGNEVITLITDPMFKRWLRAVGLPEYTDYTRIYGSKTLVIESDMEASLSIAAHRLPYLANA